MDTDTILDKLADYYWFPGGEYNLECRLWEHDAIGGMLPLYQAKAHNQLRQQLIDCHKQWGAEQSDERDRLREALGWFKGGHTDGKTAEELEEMAYRLSPGGAHNSGSLVKAVQTAILGADPKLLAVVMRVNWHGGKMGFQFLPDPAKTELWNYKEQAAEVYDTLRGKLMFGEVEWSPRDLLTNNNEERDLEFYDWLPERFTAYRGASGISAEQCAVGLCWTIDRKIAEWFANRGAGDGEPVLLSTRVRKSDVALVKATEKEVVILAEKGRVLKCPRRGVKRRPEMTWKFSND